MYLNLRKTQRISTLGSKLVRRNRSREFRSIGEVVWLVRELFQDCILFQLSGTWKKLWRWISLAASGLDVHGPTVRYRAPKKATEPDLVSFSLGWWLGTLYVRARSRKSESRSENYWGVENQLWPFTGRHLTHQSNTTFLITFQIVTKLTLPAYYKCSDWFVSTCYALLEYFRIKQFITI